MVVLFPFLLFHRESRKLIYILPRTKCITPTISRRTDAASAGALTDALLGVLPKMLPSSFLRLCSQFHLALEHSLRKLCALIMILSHSQHKRANKFQRCSRSVKVKYIFCPLDNMCIYNYMYEFL